MGFPPETYGPTITNFVKDPDDATNYTFTVTPRAPLLFSFLVASNSYMDEAGNGGRSTFRQVGYMGSNWPPVVNAGEDQTIAVAAGRTVTLGGSGMDIDGTIASHAWTRTGGTGTAVTLTNANMAQASFTANTPAAGAADVTHIFTLTVTDDDGDAGTDMVMVTVTAPPPPTPTVKGTLPTPDGGTQGMAYRMGLAQFFDNVGSYTTYSVQSATCAGFEVSGANLVGTDSGSIPSSVTTDVPCTIRATNTGVGTTADAMFTISVTVPVVANTPPRLTEATTPTPDKSVTEDDNTNNTAGSSFTVADDQQKLHYGSILH